MSARQLLEELRRSGAVLTVEGENLELDAPAGAVTEELLRSVTEHKPALLKLLCSEEGTTADVLTVNTGGIKDPPPPVAHPPDAPEGGGGCDTPPENTSTHQHPRTLTVAEALEEVNAPGVGMSGRTGPGIQADFYRRGEISEEDAITDLSTDI